MKKLFLYFIVLALFTFSACEREEIILPKKCYGITGKVVRFEDNQPVKYATIRVYEIVSVWIEREGLFDFGYYDDHLQLLLIYTTKSSGSFDISHCKPEGEVYISIQSPLKNFSPLYSRFEWDGEIYPTDTIFTKTFIPDTPYVLTIKMM